MRLFRPIPLLAIALSVIYISFIAIFYQANVNYAIDEKKQDLEHHLLFQKAMHHYIENVQKPVLYELQAKGVLEPNFFDPRILSFTYIARNTNHKYAELLLQNGKPHFKYRLVSDNARNPINDGTEAELELLRYFNDHPDIKRIDKVIEQQNQPYLYVAIPVGANQPSCMRCHGKPQDAPADLLERYGEQRGFFEQLGHKRAFIAFQVSLSEALAEAKQFFYLISAIVLLLLVGIFFGFTYFYQRLAFDKRLIDEKNQQLNYLANHDALTGCFNRHALGENLPAMLKSSSSQKCLAAIMIDADHFKNINDQYGHDAGDRVLTQLTGIFKDHLADQGQLYRLGGEEFLILMTVNDQQQAIEWLHRLYQELANPTSPLEIKVTISAGLAFAKEKDTQYTLLKRTDALMYRAKQQGRNQYLVDETSSINTEL